MPNMHLRFSYFNFYSTIIPMMSQRGLSMQIVEVKNNLVRISYDTETKLVLSGFMVIKDSIQSFISQIIHLEANQQGNYAVLKLLFTFNDEGVITGYNGSVPDVKSIVDIIQPQELLELLPVQNPIFLGDLAQQSTLLNLDRKFLEEKLLICSEKLDDSELLAKNLLTQLSNNGKKALYIDLKGTFDFPAKKIVAGKDFRLPLNYDTINFIYEKGLDDAKAETKALIQDIFLEVQEYVKSLPEKFIPFESFKDVVDSQYEELELVELVLLKNKLLKYYDAGIFAQSRTEFQTLQSALKTSPVSVLDISKMDANVQREMISYVYSLINSLADNIYVFVNIEDENSDKKLLKQIFTAQNAYSSVICEYSYKYLKELKQLAKNLIFFAPIQQQSDYAGYGVFLSKLNPHEFVIYGSMTQHLPLIVRLEAYSKYFQSESVVQEPQVQIENSLDEQINNDLDEIYSVPKSEIQKTEFEKEEYLEDEFTEDDLDMIDGLDIADVEQDFSQNETVNIAEETFDVSDLDDIPFPQVDVESQIEEFSHEGLEDQFVEEADSQEAFSFQEDEDIEEAQTFTDVMEQQEQEEISPPQADILPARISSTPIVPIYSAQVEPQAQSDDVAQGDTVVHPKYGKGVVEKLIKYGSKTLCSINFDNVGRRLLDPTLAEIKKSE